MPTCLFLIIGAVVTAQGSRIEPCHIGGSFCPLPLLTRTGPLASVLRPSHLDLGITATRRGNPDVAVPSTPRSPPGDRASEAIDSGGILPGYSGTIVRDGYKGYKHLTSTLQLVPTAQQA